MKEESIFINTDNLEFILNSLCLATGCTRDEDTPQLCEICPLYTEANFRRFLDNVQIPDPD